MKGLKIIPFFLILILLTYMGMLFVEANREEVMIQFGRFQSPPAALGFVVLTSMLIGMVVAGLLCSIELMALYMQNRLLKRRIPRTTTEITPDDSLELEDTPIAEAKDVAPPARSTGRFT